MSDVPVDSGCARALATIIQNISRLFDAPDQPAASVCTKSSGKTLEQIATFATKLSDLHPDGAALVKPIQKYAPTFDAISAMSSFIDLGVDGNTRFAKDPELKYLKAALSGSLVASSLMLEGATFSGFIIKLVAEFQTVVADFAVGADAFYTELAKQSAAKLKPVATVCGFADPADEHFLDEYAHDDDLDIEALMDFCQKTIFTVAPGGFTRLVKEAQDAKAKIVAGVEALGAEYPATYKTLETTLLSAHITMSENALLGMMAENADKPIRLKRAMKSFYATLAGDVQNGLHEVVKLLYNSLCGGEPAAKVAK